MANEPTGTIIRGYRTQIVRVTDVDATTHLATVVDAAGMPRSIRTDIMPSKTDTPIAGEQWIITNYLGFWAFAAVITTTIAP